MPSHLSDNARSLGIQRKMLPRSGPRRPRSSHLIFSSSPQMQLKIFYLTTPIWLDRGRTKTFPVLADFVERKKHVLNHCPQALSMCRFNERHDAVLEIIASFITQRLPDSYKAMAALSRHQPYVFSLHIATTDQRPDNTLYGVIYIQCKTSVGH